MTNSLERFFDQYHSHAIDEGISEKELTKKTFMDLMTMTFSLYAADPDTMSPETREVIARWRPAMDWILKN